MNKKIVRKEDLLGFNLQRFFEYVPEEEDSSCEVKLFNGNNKEEACIAYPPDKNMYLNQIESHKTSPENWGGFYNSENLKHTSKDSAFFCKEVVFVRNSYDIFNMNGKALKASYPNSEIRIKQKKSWGIGHNYVNEKNIFFPRNVKIDDDQIIEDVHTYVIKHHDDANNYFHWCFENLPNLLVLTRIIDHSFLTKIKFVVMGSLKNFQKESINKVFNAINQNPPCIHEVKNDIFYAKSAFVVHARTPGWRTKSVIREVREIILGEQLLDSNDTKNRMIFLTRGSAKNNRNIYNLNKYREYFLNWGFEFITMDDKTIDEQSKIISESKCIIGLHGAAFTNLIFANQNVSVFELVPKNYVDTPTAFISNALQFKWEKLLLDEHHEYKEKCIISERNIQQITDWINRSI